MNFSHLSSPHFNSGLSQMIISNKIIKLSPESHYQSKNNSKLSYESPLMTSNGIFIEEEENYNFLLPNLPSISEIQRDKHKNFESSKNSGNFFFEQRNENEENTHKKIQDILFKVDKSSLFDVDKLGLKKEKSFLPYINAENDQYIHQNLNRFFVFRSTKNKFNAEELDRKINDRRKNLKKYLRISEKKLGFDKSPKNQPHSYNKWFVPAKSRFEDKKNKNSLNSAHQILQNDHFIYDTLHNDSTPFVYEAENLKKSEFLKKNLDLQNQLDSSLVIGRFKKYVTEKNMRLPLMIKNNKLHLIADQEKERSKFY